MAQSVLPSFTKLMSAAPILWWLTTCRSLATRVYFAQNIMVSKLSSNSLSLDSYHALKHRIFTPRIILKRNKHRHWSWVYEDSNAVLDTLMSAPVCVVSITRRYVRSPVRWGRWKFCIHRSEVVFWRYRKITHHLRQRKWRPACKEVQMNIFSVS